MSVRSFFGQINSPEFGDKIVYANADGLVKLIKGMEINGDAGSGDQAVCSDGNGGIEWKTLTDQGVTSTLGAVMAAGASASADLDMAGHNIISDAALSLTSDEILTLKGTLGVDFGTGVGNEGSILSSNGPLPPTWVVPEIPPATADLDMTGHNLTNCAGVVNPDGVSFGVVGVASFSDAVNFSALPTCAGQPDADDQLVNKIYVDALVASGEGVSPAATNDWTAMQTFDAGFIVNNASPSFNYGAQISINGASYVASSPDIGAYYSFKATQGDLMLQTNTWLMNWQGDGIEITMPAITPAMFGISVTIVNLNNTGDGTTLLIKAPVMYNCFGRSQDYKVEVSFNRFGCITFIAGQSPTGGANYAWLATSFSSGVAWVDGA